MALTVLDAGVVIALLDATDAHHSESRAALREALNQGDDLVLPASAYSECLVGPLRRGAEAAAIVDAFLEALPARVEPITRSIARAAAALRARHGRALRLPDALVLATAIELHAHRLLTTDAGWPPLDVPVVVIAGTVLDVEEANGRLVGRKTVPAGHLDEVVGILPRPPGGTDAIIRELRGPEPDDAGS